MVFTKWSKFLWHTIHFMTLQHEFDHHQNIATDETYKTITYFLQRLHNLMNCNQCKNKYMNYLAFNPPELYNGSLFEWTIELHNHVNATLNREEWDIDQARMYYVSFWI